MYDSFCFKMYLEFFVNLCILQFTYSDITLFYTSISGYFIVLYICLGSNFVTNCTTFDQIKDECSVENDDRLIHVRILMKHFSKELYPFTLSNLYDDIPDQKDSSSVFVLYSFL